MYEMLKGYGLDMPVLGFCTNRKVINLCTKKTRTNSHIGKVTQGGEDDHDIERVDVVLVGQIDHVEGHTNRNATSQTKKGISNTHVGSLPNPDRVSNVPVLQKAFGML